MDESQKALSIKTLTDVLEKEAFAISRVIESVDHKYIDALELILNCTGKVVMTGMGKSGLIARKIAATMSSTGTLAVYMHPAEASHGDLGMVEKIDVVIALGKSGESNELNDVLPVIKKIGAKIIAITANEHSTLGKSADVVLDGSVPSEACPYDLAPTASTSVALAIGDALAITLMKLKDFKPNDFALYHPGGRLGRRLLLHVQDVMIPYNSCAVLDSSTASMKDVILALSEFGQGIVLFGKHGLLDGIMTDGDVRRLLEKHEEQFFKLDSRKVFVVSPKTVDAGAMAVEALKIMEHREKPLNVLPVMSQGKCVGIVRLHELVKVV